MEHWIETNFFWIPFFAFVFHIAEELPVGPWPGFPAWASRHFGVTSKAWYVYSHIICILIFVSICTWASRSVAYSWGSLLSFSLMWTLAINAAFHIISTILFREYS